MAMNKFQVIFLDCGKTEMQAGGQISRLSCPGFNRAKVIYVDRLCGLVVRAPGYRTEMYCVSCEVRTEFIYVM
jgi:hypothetical protein